MCTLGEPVPHPRMRGTVAKAIVSVIKTPHDSLVRTCYTLTKSRKGNLHLRSTKHLS